MIALIIPYYGALPPMLNLFLSNCESKEIDIYFVTDLDFSSFELPPNVKIVAMPLAEVSERIKVTTGIEPLIAKPYKLCDCRPLFGKVFSDITEGYDFWATGDCDLIYGNVDKYLSKIAYKSYEMISVRRFWTTGSLNIYKNCQKINELFLQNPDLRRILTTSVGFCADEAGGFWYELSQGVPLNSLNSQVQTLTHLVQSAGIRWLHEDIICEQLQRNEVLRISKGKIESSRQKDDIFAFHYANHKRTFIFSFASWGNTPETYFVDCSGFFTRKSLARATYNMLNTLRLDAFLVVKQLYRLARYRKWYPRYYL